ncbi:MAG: type II toxin-antitoxin system PemK/MazF family toxin [Spirochaetaceae bacterium]|nr:type II toxin-antitoxin system PemK/MazF family toxin [Spirochaetaceae bacterium]
MKQYAICFINLDPAVGHEIQKTRPCVIISPDEMNAGETQAGKETLDEMLVK